MPKAEDIRQTCETTCYKRLLKVHTSTKARLTSVAISVPLSVMDCDDVIVAMAMPASVCPALQCQGSAVG